MTKPRQLGPTVGPAHGGVEFLEGFLPGIKEFINFQMRKSQFEGVYISFKFIGSDS